MAPRDEVPSSGFSSCSDKPQEDEVNSVFFYQKVNSVLTLQFVGQYNIKDERMPPSSCEVPTNPNTKPRMMNTHRKEFGDQIYDIIYTYNTLFCLTILTHNYPIFISSSNVYISLPMLDFNDLH